MTALVTVDLARIQTRLSRLWVPDTAPHALVLGTVGAGKTRLIRNVFLPLAALDRVLIVDAKGGNDPSWSGCGQVVDRIEPGFGAGLTGPYARHFRLVLDRGDREAAKRTLRAALAVVEAEGHTVLVLDEIRAITDPEELACRALVEGLILRGRSDAVSMVLAGQGTAWLPAAVRDQWSFAFAGALRDDSTRKRVAEILGWPPRELVPVLRGLAKRDWCYADGEGGGAFALTDTLDRGGPDWPDLAPWAGALTPAPLVDGMADLVCPECGGPAVLSPRATVWVCDRCGMVDPAPVIEAAELARERAAQRATRAAVAVAPSYAAELARGMSLAVARSDMAAELAEWLDAVRPGDGCRPVLRDQAERMAAALRYLADQVRSADRDQVDTIRGVLGGMLGPLAAMQYQLDQDRQLAIERATRAEVVDRASAPELVAVEVDRPRPPGPAARADALRWYLNRYARPAGGRRVA